MTTNATPWNPPVGRLFVRVVRGKKPDGSISRRSQSRTVTLCYMDEPSRHPGSLRCVSIALLVDCRTSGVIIPESLPLHSRRSETESHVRRYRLATDRDLRLLVRGWDGPIDLATWLHQLEHGGGPHGVLPGLAAYELDRLRRVVAEVMAEREKSDA
jgi:hypothetical protein